MRSDAIDWSSRPDHPSLQTAPRPRLHRVLRHWFVLAALVQALATTLAVLVIPHLSWTLPPGVEPLAAIATGALAGLLITLPLVRVRAGRWTQLLHALHSAIRRLGADADPAPVPVGGDREAVYIAIAFNHMASQVLASRRELLANNAALERRIAARTADLHTANQQLERLATRDTLTGLANRHALMTELRAKLRASIDSDQDLVCIAIDLDGFKGVNDTLGHAAGDELLQLAATLFLETCRSTDTAARLGGDEFILLLPMPNPEPSEQLAGRLLAAFRQRCDHWLGGRATPTPPSLSLGLASRQATGAATPDGLLQAADEALYHAKRSGKARFSIAPARHSPPAVASISPAES